MSLESPISVLYSSEGYEISLSQSMTISVTQPGIMILGSSSIGAKFIKLSDDGSVFITGSIDVQPAGLQAVTGTVHIDNQFSYVTGSNNALIVNQGLSSSNYSDSWKVVITDAASNVLGSSSLNPFWISGSVTVSNIVNTKIACAMSSTVTGAAASTTTYTIFPANNNRVAASFYKTGAGTAYIKLGTGASPTNFTALLTNNTYWDMPSLYCGPVDVIFSGPTAGSVVGTEVYY